jgi:excisionase family DNA binding protein
MNEYLSPNEIAETLKVDPVTVRRWCLQGILPYSKFGRVVRIKSKDFIKFCSDSEI